MYKHIVKIIYPIKRLAFLYAMFSVGILVYYTTKTGSDASPFASLTDTQWSQLTAGGFVTGLVVWALASVFTIGRVGAPNNYTKHHALIHLPYTQFLIEQNVLEITEEEYGIWRLSTRYIKRDVKLDMRGWLLKKKYLYEFIASKVTVDEYMASNQPSITLPIGNQKSEKENVVLRMVDVCGNVTEKPLIKNHKVVKTLRMRFKIFIVMLIPAGHRFGKEYNPAKHVQCRLNDFYNPYSTPKKKVYQLWEID